MGSLLTSILVFVNTLVAAWLVGVVARRVLGQPVGWPRSIVLSLLAVSAGGELVALIARNAGVSPEPGAGRFEWGVILLVAMVWPWLFALLLAALLVGEILLPTGSVPGPVALARRARSLGGQSVRYAQIVAIATRHGLAGFLRRGAGRDTAGDVDGSGAARLGRALRAALTDAGATFVKLGQMLSARADLPAPLTAELAGLQSQVVPVPWDEVEQTLTRALARPLTDVFARIDPSPLAAASIGQVHAATLRDGRQVVVKVQRPGVQRQVLRDVAIIRRLARRLERETQWGRELGVLALADGFASSLREELDFRIELENLQQFGQLADRVVVPRALPELSSQAVLVMTHVAGTPLGAAGPVVDALAAPARSELARTLLREVLEQIVVHGTFHADLHPGNVLIDDDGTLALLDLGSVGRLAESERLALAALFSAIDVDDAVAATDALLELLGAPTRQDGFDRVGFERRLGRLLVRSRGMRTSSSSAVFAELVVLVTGSGFAVPDQVAAVFRTMASLEGALMILDPTCQVLALARSEGEKVAGRVLDRRTVLRRVRGQVLAMLPSVQRLPGRLAKITSDLEQGRATVRMRLFDDPADRRFVTGLVRQGITAVLGAVFLLAAAILLVAGTGIAVGTVDLGVLLATVLGLIGAVLCIRVLLFALGQRDRVEVGTASG